MTRPSPPSKAGAGTNPTQGPARGAECVRLVWQRKDGKEAASGRELCRGPHEPRPQTSACVQMGGFWVQSQGPQKSEHFKRSLLGSRDCPWDPQKWSTFDQDSLNPTASFLMGRESCRGHSVPRLEAFSGLPPLPH